MWWVMGIGWGRTCWVGLGDVDDQHRSESLRILSIWAAGGRRTGTTGCFSTDAFTEARRTNSASASYFGSRGV